MTQIDVALATYNGSRYLPALLDSLEKQRLVSVRVVASDDGSIDTTVDILKLTRHGLSVIVAPSVSRGSILRNFENALSRTDAPYIALCDQDDVWHFDKLNTMVLRIQQLEMAHGSHTPILVFCDLEVVDEDLGVVSASFYKSTLKSSRASRLADFALNNHIPGCAMMINRALLGQSLPFPDVDAHDHWIALIAATSGKIDFVNRPLIKYRQHEGNNVGLGAAGQHRLARLRALFSAGRIFIARRERWTRQAISIRRNLAALRDTYRNIGLTDIENNLIDSILAGDIEKMRNGLNKGLVGERAFDYYGIIWALSNASKAGT